MTADHFRTTTMYGRQYQEWSLNHQINLEPVDEKEESRLHSQHELLKLLFAQRRNPLVPDSILNPVQILDCGYGTGEWASEVAESFPNCQVTGIDICPIIVQQNDRPDNFVPEMSTCVVWCLDIVADLNKSNEAFEFMTESFDYVNSRFVAGGLAQARWPSYVTDIRRVLKKGGAVEFVEWDMFFRANGGNGDRLAALRLWTNNYLDAIGKGVGDARKSRQTPPDIENILQSSGFVNVSSTAIEIPLGRWPSTTDQREIGERAKSVVTDTLESWGLYPMVNRGLMSEGSFRDLIARCIQEMEAQDTHVHIRLYVCYGEKPK